MRLSYRLSLHGQRYPEFITDLSETGCQCVIRRRLDVTLGDDPELEGQGLAVGRSCCAAPSAAACRTARRPG